jgi:hypothetical protein
MARTSTSRLGRDCLAWFEERASPLSFEAFHRRSAEYRLSSFPNKALTTGAAILVGAYLKEPLLSKGCLGLEEGIALTSLDFLKLYA